MSEKKVQTFPEWLKERKDFTSDNRARALAFFDTAIRPEDKSRWDWFKCIFDELNSIYSALGWVDDYRINGEKGISKKVKENEDKLSELQKSIESRDKEITDILVKIRGWIDEYQPILDKAKKEYKQLGKMKKGIQ